MRLGFLVSTFAFWGMIIALAVAGATAPGTAPAGSNERAISAEELAKHARADVGWRSAAASMT